MVTTAVSAMMGAFATIGAVGILANIGEEVHNLYEKYLDVGAAAKKYAEEVQKTSEADFGNTRSIEDTDSRIQIATTHLRAYQQAQNDLQSHASTASILDPTGFSALKQLYDATQASKLSVTEKQNLDKLKPEKIEQQHKLNDMVIEGLHASDASLVGERKRSAELQKQVQLAGELRSYNASMDSALHNHVDPNAGEAEQALQIQIAAGKYASERAVQQRGESEAIMKSRHEAVEANLQGEALYHRKMVDDIEDLKKKLIDSGKAAEIPAAVQAVNEKYFADMSQRTVELQNKTALALQQSQVDAMTPGIRKVEAEHDLHINRNNTTLSGDERASANVAAEAEANKQIGAIYDERDMQEAEDAKKAADQRMRIDDMESSYAKQAADAQRRVRADGLAGWVSDYQNAIAAIQAQDQDQTTKLNKIRVDEELSDAQYGQAKANIDAAANSQITAQNQQMQHQIASTLEQAFTNPIDFIKSKMQQMMMEIIANWIMQTKMFKSVFGPTMGAAGGAAGMQIGAQQGAGAGGILGSIGGLVRGTFPGHPVASAQASSAGTGGTNSNGIPQFDPSSPALQSHFVGGSGTSGGSSAASTAASDAGAVATGIPGLYRRISQARSAASNAPSSATTGGATDAQAADISGAGVPSISGAGVPSISGSGLPGVGPSGAPSINGSGSIPTFPGGTGSSGTGGTTGGATAAQTGMGVAAAGMAGYEGYQDTTAAYKSGTIGGTLKGAMNDAMVGATIGMMVGGPAGALVGAGIGAVVGLAAGSIGMMMGEGGNLAARDYYKKTLFPQIETERNGEGSTDYQTAISAVNRTASDGMSYMAQHWGAGAAKWVDDNYLLKEQKLAVGELEARAKGGSYAVKMSAAQFHGGGRIDGFGSFSTSGDEGFVHARLGEAVMNPGAVSMHGSTIDAMNGGASPTDIAQRYLAGSGASSSPAASGGGDTHHHYNISAMDAKSFDHYLRNGGARQIVKHTNQFASQYAGDGISG